MKYKNPNIDPKADEEDINLGGKRVVGTKEQRDRRNYRGTWHRTEDVSPWKRADHILASGIGRPFDELFSAWCKQVPKYQQHIFLENVDPTKDMVVPRWRKNMYYVDNGGFVRKRRRTEVYPWLKNKRVEFTSFDYKTELRNKKTGAKKPSRVYYGQLNMRELNEFYGKDAVKGKPHHVLTQMYDDMFEQVVVNGWVKTFRSSKDPEYCRLMAERAKAIRKSRRLADRLADEKVYSFTHETEAQRIERISENFFKILKHGFDPENSFHKDPES